MTTSIQDKEPSIDAYFIGLDLYHITGGKRGYPLGKAVEYAEAYVRSIKNQAEEELLKWHARYQADIYQAIGYSQGLGHPNNYLEKQYPEIVALHSTNNSLEEK